MNILLRWAARLIVMSFLALTRQTAAQTSSLPGDRTNGPRVPVTVALADELPDPNARYVILREPGHVRPDIILLHADADEQTFSEAVRALLLARRNGGDLPTAGGLLRVRQSSAERNTPVLPWAHRVLNDIRTASPRPVEGVGTVRSVEIWLPRQNGRN